MTKPSPSSSSLGSGIPTRRRTSATTPTGASSSTGGGSGSKANRNNGGSAAAAAANLASSRPRRRGRGLPLTRASVSTKKPSLAASAANPEDTDHSSTASEDETTPTKPAASSSKGNKSTPGSTSSKTRHGSAFQTPSPKIGGSGGGTTSSSSGGLLTAVNKQGKSFKVNIIVNGDIFSPLSSSKSGGSSSTRKRTLRGSALPTTMTTATLAPNNEVLVETISTPPTTPGSGGSRKKITSLKNLPAGVPLGQDGNLFHCFVCGEFGDVVCCDGCPNVYHTRCMSKDDPSRIALENDEDPWYCPSCLNSSSKKNKRDTKNSQRSSKGQFVKKKNKSKNRDKGASSSFSALSPDGSVGASPGVARIAIKDEDRHKPSDLSSPLTVAGVVIKEELSSDEDIRSPPTTAAAGTGPSPSTTAASASASAVADGVENKGKKENGHTAGPMDASGTASTPEKVGSSPDPKLTSLSSKKKKKRKRNLLDEIKDGMTPPDALETAGAEGGDQGSSRRTRSASTHSLDDALGVEGDQQVIAATPSSSAASPPSMSDIDPVPSSKLGSGDPMTTPTPKKKKRKKEGGEKTPFSTPGADDDPPLSSKKDRSSSTKKKRIRPMLPKSSRSQNNDSPITGGAKSPSPINVASDMTSPGVASLGTPSLTDSAKKPKKKKEKKKKKKKKPVPEEDQQPPDDDLADDDSGVIRPFYSSGNAPGAKAMPAFYFFLAENRPKIERNLSRKHRFFNRLPKGLERNELVCKEAASWWVKLRPSEIRRYMNMSMRDYEQRIIEWKEEKNIREMLLESDQMLGDGGGDGTELSFEDEMLTQKNHERLYLGTTVGSKPFRPEPDESHNRVLLELLQDMRFHPVPMFVANRTETEYGQMDFARITIPYFDVHGPVSTSVGDECLGCTRGWTHFCNVLKRRIPAVEHRAKLQPPLSSLIATRVGLGMRPKPHEDPAEEKPKTEEGENKDKDAAELFEERQMEEAESSKHLPWVPWDSLKTPSERADDIVQFIEEAVSMKVLEPPRPGVHDTKPLPQQPPPPEETKKNMMPRAILPTRGKKQRPADVETQSIDINEEGTVNKCGRCRTIIQNDTGCIQCRRAQLVINMSKRPGKDDSNNHGGSKTSSSSKGDKGSAKDPVKVQTYMLGRINMKEGSGEVQSEGDQAIANGILRQRWTPYIVLPPHTLDAPTPHPKRNREEDEDEGDEDNFVPICQEISKDPSSFDTAPEKGNQLLSEEGEADSKLSDPVSAVAASEDGSDESNSRPSKRIRSARIGAQAGAAEPLDDADRLMLAQRYKEEADELHKKCLSVACCGILLGLMRRDPLLLFASPVTAEGYSAIIKNPIDFEKIRSNVLAGKYVTLGSFVSDARLLCTNALAYNPPGSIYWKTAKELYDVLAVMQKRASNWMGAVKDAHAFAWRRAPKTRAALGGGSSAPGEDGNSSLHGEKEDEFIVEDPFESLREDWPEAVEMLENSDWLRQCIKADFMRTKENETAYYGSLAVRRAAVAAEASLAPYPDTSGTFSTVGRRNHVEDEHLRRLINDQVAEVIDPVELKDMPTWREESVIRVMRRAQSRRLEGLTGSVNGSARCDGIRVDQELKMAMAAEGARWGRSRRKTHEKNRVHPSRVDISTGLASQNTMKKIKENREKSNDKDERRNRAAKGESKAAAAASAAMRKVPKIGDSPPDVAVSVRGSRVHGWGLFADQPFRPGDVVAEYVGEYVSLAVTEAREKAYQEQRIQDYQFRLDDQLVIDATMRGGHGRYINHNCSPNCIAKIIPGKAPNEHLKRVVIIAHRDIKPREELTYDYQFPLELDLDARIPCNCHSEHCRGFMNWDLPEKGANTRTFRTQKRGANMRDRIRRLGRPLKSDK